MKEETDFVSKHMLKIFWFVLILSIIVTIIGVLYYAEVY